MGRWRDAHEAIRDPAFGLEDPSVRAPVVEPVFYDGDEIDDEWRALADRAASDPCSGPGWVRAWWDAFGDGGRLRLLALQDASGLRALIPLIWRRGSARFPANDHTPVVSLLADNPASLARLAQELMRLARVDLRIPGLHGHEASLAALKAAGRRSGMWLHLSHNASPPYLDLFDVEDPLLCLSSKRAKELRRRHRRLVELGDYASTVHSSVEGLGPLLDRAFAVEAKQWKGAGGSAILSSPTLERFYRAIAADAARCGRLRLTSLSVDDRMVAFSLGLVAGSVHYGFKIGYDPDFGRYSPGHLLIADVLRRAIAEGGTRFEFLGHDDRYKMDWTSTTRPDITLFAAPRGPRGTAAYLLYRGLPVAQRTARRIGRTAVSRHDG